jgi:pullulanase
MMQKYFERYATKEFEDKYTYKGNDLGAVWSRAKTVFRLWAPEAQAVSVCLYASGTPEAYRTPCAQETMQADKGESDKCESDKCDADKCDADKCDADKCDTDNCDADKCESDKCESDKCEADKCDADKCDADKCDADKGDTDKIEQIVMRPDVCGTWLAEKEGDISGVYYTYLVTREGKTVEVCDPYARTTGVNGKRAMVLDLTATNPAGWERDSNPHAGEGITDAVIYELHVRDFSVDENSGIEHKGKFAGVTESGTTTKSGRATGLDHMKELGITHLHLLPVYDYGSVDESRPEEPQFNWGYDPVNYNVPEGSYATDPFHGEVRVREMKEMVKALHDNGISVVMDVVYNHVYDRDSFCINQILPGYFSRQNDDGSYSNGSGCGNDTASERAMVRKYIVDSVKYWADEYHIDGFRFDLVGLIDTETTREILQTVKKDHPDTIFYGEGWTMETAVFPKDTHLTTQTNADEVPGFAFFSDTMRDGLKGRVFYPTEPGYISGAEGLEEIIAKCFLGQAPDWCHAPSQAVNYASCHDNMTLLDRIFTVDPNENGGFKACQNPKTREGSTELTAEAAFTEDAARIRMNNLAAAIYMFAQGIPFFQAGEELLRRKLDEEGNIVDNSYRSPDEVNQIRWEALDEPEHQSVYRYYRGLIAFRKAHSLLRLATIADVQKYVTQIKTEQKGVLAFYFQNETQSVQKENAREIFIIYNASRKQAEVALPAGGRWSVYVNAVSAGTGEIGQVTGEKAVIEPISALVLAK